MKQQKKISWKFISGILMICLVLAGCVGVFLYKNVRHLMYQTTYSGAGGSYQEQFYKGKNVMIIVPHEDDEINVAGGVIEAYAEAGSTVRVVFGTNGDGYGGGERRLSEALTSLNISGIPEENIIFLGYGDDWNTEYGHLYDAPEDAPLVSLGGNTQTYGLPTHPDYHTQVYGEPALYTRGNYKADIKDVILRYQPDVIYCVDNDEHPDHKGLSLLFEEAMAEILQNKDNGYHPIVMKGFGYCTGWEAVKDYYGYNVLSTKNPDDHDYMERRWEYNWSERVQLPVTQRQLAYTKRSSLAYATTGAHESQDARSVFLGVVNADKVFWQRETDSLTYQAEISVSSGDGSLLNDFKLSDTDDIRDRDPDDKNYGTWIPLASDTEKRIRVEFKEAADLSKIVLYDNIQPDQNITSGRLLFSDGSEEMVPALQTYGAATEVCFDQKHDITWFEFLIISSEGESAGLTEIEAYTEPVSEWAMENAWIKWTTDENFLYDVYYEMGKDLELSLYAYPDANSVSEVNAEDMNLYEITLDGNLVDINQEKHAFVFSPDGKTHVLRAERKTDEADGSQNIIFDEIRLKPLKLTDRMLIWICQKLEVYRDRKQQNG